MRQLINFYKIYTITFVTQKLGENMKVLNNVKQIRIDKGLSLRELELLSDVGYSTIRKIEKGECIPNQVTMMKISRGLNRETYEVFDLSWKHNHM